MKVHAAAGLAAIALAACAPRPPVEPVGPAFVSAQADARDPAGRVLARGTATQETDGVRIRVEAVGLAQGIYAAHVHRVGRCDPPAFESAGPHWNPTDRQHGFENPHGHHLGDLPNLMVGADRRGTFEFVIRGATLSGGPTGMLDEDGASLVVHARADDHRTDPSGNSGDRIACGIFR